MKFKKVSIPKVSISSSLSVLFLFILTMACSRLEKHDFARNNESYYYNKDSTFVIICDKYSLGGDQIGISKNGKVVKFANRKDSTYDGFYMELFENGRLKILGEFDSGVPVNSMYMFSDTKYGDPRKYLLFNNGEVYYSATSDSLGKLLKEEGVRLENGNNPNSLIKK